MSNLRPLVVLCLALPLLACGADTDSEESQDAGARTPDLGVLEPDAGATPDAGPPPDAGAPPDAGEDPAGVEASPTEITFRHEPGVTPCPQALDLITLTNLGSTPVGFTVRPLGMELFVLPQSGTIPAEGAVELDLQFTCNVAQIPLALEATLTVDFDDGSPSVEVSIFGDVR